MAGRRAAACQFTIAQAHHWQSIGTQTFSGQPLARAHCS
eukprot:CAMPEP_0185199834 /NCGR_PEP_ID=MMETSP1140-20130426/45951_1 /TAXON_ID=298111 /ORGANISM="Pavlova sp., Strain CCMP459" /LENGTH=38 /DNA_ID= /DNA_START= /DNA_END= /DNA_ORIENTATION=